jgi:GntR family transcriptional repressor for pyruvate dehydrogenase complex
MPEPKPLLRLEKSETLVERVVGQIQSRILDGGWPEGHRLPSERQLGEDLGVSRTVVRESLSALSAKGLIEPSLGGGFLVTTPISSDLIPSLTLFLRAGKPHLDYLKVDEVRQLLEVEIAALAAVRRNESDLESLENSLNQMKALASPFDVEAFAGADVEFHMLLARAAHNPLLWLLMEAVADIMRDVRRIGSRVPGQPARAIHHHRAILKAVKLGDPSTAREAMRRHLMESYSTMIKAMKQLKEGGSDTHE